MDNPLYQLPALQKIYRSLLHSTNVLQVKSTEHFMQFYYQHFPFDYHYFKLEWLSDTVLLEKRRSLSIYPADEGAPDEEWYVEKRSLRRLDNYLQSLSVREFHDIWPQLRNQLRGVDVVEVCYYPGICEKLASVRQPFHQYPEVAA